MVLTSETEVMGRLLLAAFLGFLICLEQEVAVQPAQARSMSSSAPRLCRRRAP